MVPMQLARRLSAFALAMLVAFVAATPLEALACGKISVCPMMKALAGGKAAASCHGARSAAQAGMSMPMDCCRSEKAAPVAPAVTAHAAAPAVSHFAFAAVAAVALAATPEVAPRADHAALGLYTLHAVWRI